MLRNLLASVVVLFASQALMADEKFVETGKRPLTTGIGAMYKDKPCKDYASSQQTSAIPLALYGGNDLFARGSTIGWDFLDIGDSPIVEDDTELTAITGIACTFRN